MALVSPSAGLRLADPRLMERFGARMTRYRRRESDLLPHGETMLALADHLRLVADPARWMPSAPASASPTAQ